MRIGLFASALGFLHGDFLGGLRTRVQGLKLEMLALLERAGAETELQRHACFRRTHGYCLTKSWKNGASEPSAAELAGNTTTKCAAKPPAANPAEQRFSQVQDMSWN